MKISLNSLCYIYSMTILYKYIESLRQLGWELRVVLLNQQRDKLSFAYLHH